MKLHLFPLSAAGLGLLIHLANAGITAGPVAPAGDIADGFAAARRPITNPTLFDTPLPTTNVHPIIIYQNLPDYVNVRLPNGTRTELPLGGDAQVYALQFEIALSERLSLVATKDGYVVFDPDLDAPGTWSDETGWANLAAGLKYAFLLDPAKGAAVAGTATFELPTGNHDVFQGEGEGAVNLIIEGLKMWDAAQLAGAAGFRIPFTDQLATDCFVSGHFSYEVCRWFIPLVEVNWFHVLDTGDGKRNFGEHWGGLVPAVATFEGGDLLNFGASNASDNRDFVSAAVGFRSRLAEGVDLGFAYEIPLTDDNDGIMDERFTLDLVWRF